ncbi:DUF2304 domain-containing protein [Nonomuraea africana]|uniref:DUF2304 domain-containing protein n=1 Tax=Nonomuraea africana TaxID=46171 RepID=A0ABR9KV38_9ACTN|nr:DUF2304 domain-containing protein [Nonomuraea africana]MBE1565483.1 hypothetical protein [Nonomuraea africana]
MSAYTLGVLGAAVTMTVIFEMLRRRKLREKYAVFWMLLSAVMVLIAVMPGLLEWAADVTGVQVPSNLLFFGGSLLLLAVNVQLSSEVGRLEERTRTLAEEVAMLRFDADRMLRAESRRSSSLPS